MAEMTEGTGRAVHPLVHAGAWLLNDLLSTLAFVALFAITQSVYVSTAAGIGFGICQISWMRYRDKEVDLLQWLSLFLVVVFGSATLLTHNPRFIMFKPTLIYIAVGIVMLRPNWMNRYVPPIARGRSEDGTYIFGYVWAGMMFFTAAANIGFALLASTATWIWFMGVFPLASKLGLFAVQYLTTRMVVRRRMLTA